MRKNSKKLTVTLPLELIREILLRLPVRSLLLFKSVCKSWLSLISNPQFAISHFDLAAAPTHRLLLRSTNFYIESLDVDAPLRDHNNVVNLLLPPPSPPARDDYEVEGSDEDATVLGSCRGFVLLLHERGDLILWNPSTGAHRKLAGRYGEDIMYEFLYGFGYDSSMDDYLFILISLNDPEVVEGANWVTQFQIFSLKTNSLNNAEYISVQYREHGDLAAFDGAPLNEALHWLVFSEDKKVPVIIAFGLIERTLSEIPLPHCLTERHELYSLRVIGGCLSVCCRKGFAIDEIWIMKEYKVQSSWTKSLVMSSYDYRYHFYPIYSTKDGGILGTNYPGRLEKFNDKGKGLEALDYSRSKRWYGANLHSAVYRESLLSLPVITAETSNVIDYKN